MEKDDIFRFYEHRKPFSAFCEFQFASHEAIGVGGKYGMRKEGQEPEGMKEERGVQSNEEGGEQGSCCLPLYLLSEVQGGLLRSQGSCLERKPFFSPGPR